MDYSGNFLVHTQIYLEAYLGIYAVLISHLALH